uniref:hypothetical protein n=1 Tax=uncultured Microscilla sp. TaxID=432653 RepID=UPI00260F5995
MNGGYFFDGALHFYGACVDLSFHSMMSVNNHLRSCYKDLFQGIFSFGEDLFVSLPVSTCLHLLLASLPLHQKDMNK